MRPRGGGKLDGQGLPGLQMGRAARAHQVHLRAQRRARLQQEQGAVQAPDLRQVAEREAALSEAEEALASRQGALADAQASLRRSDFGLSNGLPFIGDEVRLRIQVEAYLP